MGSTVALLVLVALAVGIVALVATFARLVAVARQQKQVVPPVTDSDLAARRTVARLDRISNSLRADLRQWERGRR